jgi:hypothetical protein
MSLNTKKNSKNEINDIIKDMNNKINILMQKIDVNKEQSDIINDNNNTKNQEITILEPNKNDTVKPKKRTKTEIFQKERQLFLQELENKMGLSDVIRCIPLYELENNENLKKYLKDKIVDIQKFYKCGSWNYFIKLNSNNLTDEIGLLKSIFKSEKYSITNKRINRNINGTKKLCSILYFHKS